MDDLTRQLEKKKFFEFTEAIEDRVGTVAEQKGSTYRRVSIGFQP